MKGGTKKGAAKAVDTKREVYGEDVFAKYGSKGGHARNQSPKKHLTFKDGEKASEAGAKGAAIRWENYRRAKQGLPPLPKEEKKPQARISVNPSDNQVTIKQQSKTVHIKVTSKQTLALEAEKREQKAKLAKIREERKIARAQAKMKANIQEQKERLAKHIKKTGVKGTQAKVIQEEIEKLGYSPTAQAIVESGAKIKNGKLFTQKDKSGKKARHSETSKAS